MSSYPAFHRLPLPPYTLCRRTRVYSARRSLLPQRCEVRRQQCLTHRLSSVVTLLPQSRCIAPLDGPGLASSASYDQGESRLSWLGLVIGSGEASQGYIVSGPPLVCLRYNRVTRCHPAMAFVGRLQNLDLSRSCYPSYGAPTLTPVGLSPTGRASLRWTHNGRYGARCMSYRVVVSRQARAPALFGVRFAH
jgi:hypothetical protein